MPQSWLSRRIDLVSEVFNLRGKTALVAGDGRFWARYAAIALAEAGAEVAIAGKNSAKLQEIVNQVKQLGGKAVGIPTELTISADVQKMTDWALKEYGRIDILVNANDLQFAKPFITITEDEWHQVMQANLTPVFLCCQAVGVHMLQQKKGRIINITSILAERGLSNCAAYCAAMGGVLQLTRTLALEWARDSVTVNAISAGWFSEVDRPKTEEEINLINNIPSMRYGHPAEIGSLVVYLASDNAGYMTGQTQYIDGGAMVR
jgi:NAD(P)-dependent dehydrogenase (short-subunit alcohol dehydrogenase family)